MSNPAGRWMRISSTRRRGPRCGVLPLRWGLRGLQWVLFRTASQRRKERCDDLELEVVLVAVAVGPPLEDADLVVESLDQAEADLVLGSAVGGDAVPVALDHGRELPVGREPLPVVADNSIRPSFGPNGSPRAPRRHAAARPYRSWSPPTAGNSTTSPNSGPWTPRGSGASPARDRWQRVSL